MAVGDTGALGLDAAFPAVLLALILPSRQDPATRRAALVGVTVALVTRRSSRSCSRWPVWWWEHGAYGSSRRAVVVPP